MKWCSIHIRDMSPLLHPASAAVPRKLPNLGLGSLTGRRAPRLKVGAQSHGYDCCKAFLRSIAKHYSSLDPAFSRRASRSSASVSDARLAGKPRATGTGLKPRANVASRTPVQVGVAMLCSSGQDLSCPNSPLTGSSVDLQQLTRPQVPSEHDQTSEMATAQRLRCELSLLSKQVHCADTSAVHTQ